MRTLALPFAIWVGVLQLPPSNQSPVTLAATATLLSAAAALAALSVGIYRLGVWRQEMSNTKDNVGAEIVRHREESAQQFGNIDRRLAAVELRLRQLARRRAR
jgi:hypothetical protein